MDRRTRSSTPTVTMRSIARAAMPNERNTGMSQFLEKDDFQQDPLLFETRPTPSCKKWQTDLPETRKCAVSQTKKFTNSLFGLCMHWIGSGSKQHKKRRGKLVLMGPSDAAGGPRWLASAAEELTPLPLS